MNFTSGSSSIERGGGVRGNNLALSRSWFCASSKIAVGHEVLEAPRLSTCTRPCVFQVVDYTKYLVDYTYRLIPKINTNLFHPQLLSGVHFS